MRKRTVTARVWLITLATVFVTPVIASQQGKPTRGARVAVVAIHDSRLLTICPVLGKNVMAAGGLNSETAAKFSVGRPAEEGLQSITGPFGDQAVALLLLPVPPSTASAGASTPLVPTVRLLDRLARDVDVQRRVEERFRTLKTYTVVGSPADADFVFLVESYYAPWAASWNQVPPRLPTATDTGKNTPERIFSDTESEWNRRQWGWGDRPRPPETAPYVPVSFVTMSARGGDRYAGWRETVLAIAVPASVYQQYVGNGEALTAARLWQGVAPPERVKRRWEDVSAAEREAAGWKRMSIRERAFGPGGYNTKAASPEALVDQFHGKAAKLPDYLPVCAATSGTIRQIGGVADSSGTSARDTQSLADPPPERTKAPADGAIEAGVARFRSNITLVTVPATVTDSDGRNVVDLQPSAFRLFEDGIEQKIDRVEPGTASSSVALLVDTSSGMRLASDGIRSAALSLVSALRPSDRAMVVSFDRRIRVLSEFTSSRAELERAISQLRPRGFTRLYDALSLSVLDRINAVEGRKAIVLFTDGVDTGSQLTNAVGALAAIDTSNIAVYVIRYDTSDAESLVPTSSTSDLRWLARPDDTQKSPKALAAADQFLGRLAIASGGRMYLARPDANVREMVAQISDELSRQYLLRYYPANDKLDGAYREIRVVVDRPGATVRARTGYRAGALQTGR